MQTASFHTRRACLLLHGLHAAPNQQADLCRSFEKLMFLVEQAHWFYLVWPLPVPSCRATDCTGTLSQRYVSSMLHCTHQHLLSPSTVSATGCGVTCGGSVR